MTEPKKESVDQANTLDESELRLAAGSYVADELSAEERAAFEKLQGYDASLKDEQVFWEQMRPALSKHGRPEAKLPGQAFTDRLHFRLHALKSEEQDRAPVARRSSSQTLQWSGWAIAAAACLFLMIGGVGFVKPGMTYLEDGSAVLSYSDANRAKVVNVKADAHSKESIQRHNEPWLGMRYRPVRFTEDNKTKRGLLVEQVFADSPAHKAGIQPGDVVFNLAGCPLNSRHCIAHALKEEAAQDKKTLTLNFWCADDQATKSTEIKVSESFVLD